MRKLTYKRLLSMLLAVVMTFSGLITLFPLEAEAASQYITGINVTADTTRTVSVSFHYSKDTSDEDVQSLFVALYNADTSHTTTLALITTTTRGATTTASSTACLRTRSTTSGYTATRSLPAYSKIRSGITTAITFR